MTSRLDVITGRMSKLMLKRWTMLADLCHIDGCSAPLMRNPETQEDKCVWHNAQELFPDEIDHTDVDDNTKDHKISAASQETTSQQSPVLYDLEPDMFPEETPEGKKRREKREQGDRASQVIAKKLLQGWTMVDESCPNEKCYSVPLIRDHDMVQLCVICGQKYMDEKTYAKKYGSTDIQETNKLNADSDKKETAENADDSSAKVAEKPVEGNEEPVPSFDAMEHPYLAICPPKPANFITSTDAAETAQDALNAKLTELSAKMAAATSYRDIRQISKAIGACAKALRECQKL
ncbi:hypothetical protein H4R99_006797 [Coemansia sp. RSA 1722]|nr:hypothetical protein LPJ57_003188 [Coemansia sp. RSA 486]KAJ2233811.1 hypothetical protein IWW45_003893 [Coemansia sp. RSA 485]KAJ2591321.1 hypothetical protein H4R99_006797 [Coemansia sp. RSA 1722]